MWWNLGVFALIGLLAGASARLFYPGRQPMRIMATLVLGMVGSLLGGLLSWAFWPAVDRQFSFGALLRRCTGYNHVGPAPDRQGREAAKGLGDVLPRCVIRTIIWT